MTKIELSLIVLDETVYPRHKVNPHNVESIRDVINTGHKLPPMLIEKGTNVLVDGWHRHGAYEAEGIEVVTVKEKVYTDRKALLSDAVNLNMHGQQLSPRDKLRSAALLLEAGFSMEKVSEIVRVPMPKLQGRLERRTAFDGEGEQHILKRGMQHNRGRTLTDKQVAAHERYGGHNASRYARMLFDTLKQDLWPKDSEPFITTMNDLTSLWQDVYPAEAAE